MKNVVPVYILLETPDRLKFICISHIVQFKPNKYNILHYIIPSNTSPSTNWKLAVLISNEDKTNDIEKYVFF